MKESKLQIVPEANKRLNCTFQKIWRKKIWGILFSKQLWSYTFKEALKIRIKKTGTRARSITALTREVASKRSRGLPLDLAGLLPGMLRARTEGCAPLSSRSFAASLSRPTRVKSTAARTEVCVQFPVSRCPRVHRDVRSGTIVIVIPDLWSSRNRSVSPLRLSGSCTIRMHRSAPENGNRNWYVSRINGSSSIGISPLWKSNVPLGEVDFNWIRWFPDYAFLTLVRNIPLKVTRCYMKKKWNRASRTVQ